MNKSIRDNLDETRSKLEEEIAFLTDDQFNSKQDGDNWSIAQVCHHLVLVEESSLKAIAWGLKEENNTAKERIKVDLIMDRTKKIKAPKIVEPSIEPFEVQQIIDLLNVSRNKLMTFLNGLEEPSVLKEKSVKHPALGELPLDQWVEQIYLHELRHIEQIREIKSLLGVSH